MPDCVSCVPSNFTVVSPSFPDTACMVTFDQYLEVCDAQLSWMNVGWVVAALPWWLTSCRFCSFAMAINEPFIYSVTMVINAGKVLRQRRSYWRSNGLHDANLVVIWGISCLMSMIWIYLFMVLKWFVAWKWSEIHGLWLRDRLKMFERWLWESSVVQRFWMCHCYFDSQVQSLCVVLPGKGWSFTALLQSMRDLQSAASSSSADRLPAASYIVKCMKGSNMTMLPRKSLLAFVVTASEMSVPFVEILSPAGDCIQSAKATHTLQVSPSRGLFSHPHTLGSLSCHISAWI